MGYKSPRIYCLTIQTGTHNFVDSTTYYFSSVAGVSSTGAIWDSHKQIIPLSGTIRAAQVHVISTGADGSNESWPMYIRVNDATDYLIQSVTQALYNRYWKNSNLNIPINEGDFIALKTVCPAWATNPNTSRVGAVFILETS